MCEVKQMIQNLSVWTISKNISYGEKCSADILNDNKFLISE